MGRGGVLWFVCICEGVALGAMFHELENLTLYGFVYENYINSVFGVICFFVSS